MSVTYICVDNFMITPTTFTRVIKDKLNKCDDFNVYIYLIINSAPPSFSRSPFYTVTTHSHSNEVCCVLELSMELKVISLCHQYQSHAILHIHVICPASILLANHHQVLILISWTVQNGRWIIPFKKFIRLMANIPL